MAQVFEVPAEMRTDKGKGASRRLRREGLVPGVVYGGDRDAANVQISHRFLIRALEEESFYSSILQLTVGDGRTQRVILRDLQRHPWKRQVMHIDFQRVSESEKLRLSVPLHFINEERSPAGKKSGVVISHQFNEVEVSCLPKDLPEYLEIDLASMNVGDIIHLSDIALPEGVELTQLAHGEDSPVVTAHHVTVAETTDEAVEAPSPEVPTLEEDEEDAEGGDEG